MGSLGHGLYLGGKSAQKGALLNLLPLSKLSLFTKKTDQTDSYYVNKIGLQDRQLFSQNGIDGILHPGKAIHYDTTKSQYSRTSGPAPANMRLVNNDITISFWLKFTNPVSGFGLVFGQNVATSGEYSILINADGTLRRFLYYNGGSITSGSFAGYNDGNWHHICWSIQRTGAEILYVDRSIISRTDISARTFSDNARYICIGGQPGAFGGTKTVRDFRMFDRALNMYEVWDLYDQKYVSTPIAWWLMEDGRESNSYSTKDSIGVNHLTNYGFDSASLVSGYWSSLFNKYGYSVNTGPVYTPPKLDVSNPVNDINNMPLVFKGQAKYNLSKNSPSSVIMPDNINELITDTELNFINDWYTLGQANAIEKADIVNLLYRQYYNDDSLIIVKSNESINASEHRAIVKSLKLPSESNKFLQNGGVFLSFDDAYSLNSLLYADAILAKYNWKMTFAVETLASFITEAEDIAFIQTYKPQIERLIYRGHELANHSLRHTNLQTWLSSGKSGQEYYDERILPLQQIFKDIIGLEPVSHLHSAWYGFNLAVGNLVLNNGFKTVRQNLATYPADIATICYNGTSNVVLSFDISYPGSSYTDAQIEALLEYAKINKVIVNIFSHVIVPTITSVGQVSIDRMIKICKYVQDNQMTFVSASELDADIFK